MKVEVVVPPLLLGTVVVESRSGNPGVWDISSRVEEQR